MNLGLTAVLAPKEPVGSESRASCFPLAEGAIFAMLYGHWGSRGGIVAQGAMFTQSICFSQPMRFSNSLRSL